MTAHTLTYSTTIDASLAGQYIPQSAFFNAQLTWDGMTKVNFAVGTNPYGTGTVLSPGGTAYHAKTDGTADPLPYFPQGNDWAANPVADVDYVLYDVYSGMLGLDAGQSLSAMDFATAQVNALKGLQIRAGHNGNLYQSGDWTSAQDEIEVVTYQDLSEAWMVWWLDQHNMVSPTSDHWGAVPEPSTITLLLISFGAAMLYVRKRRTGARQGWRQLCIRCRKMRRWTSFLVEIAPLRYFCYGAGHHRPTT
jgi:hypothetical protein